MTTTEATPDIDKNPLLSVWFILSACLMLALLVGLVVIFTSGDGEREIPDPIAVSGECNLPGTEETALTGVPQVGWVAVGGGRSAVPAPHTEAHGPAVMTDGVPSCWARTPFGAVSAAATVAALGSAGMDHSLYRDLTVPGRERDLLLAETPEDTAPFQDGTEIVGFRLVDYTPEEATVTIVAADQEGLLMAGTYDVVYTDGDWRYDPPTSLEPEFTEPDNMDGYIEFPGGPTDG